MADAKETNGIKHADVVHLLGRLDRAEIRKNAIQADIRTIYDDGESKGIDRKALRRLLAKHKLPAVERAQQDLLDAVLERAAGLADTAPTYDEAAGDFAIPHGLEDAAAQVEADGDDGTPPPPEPPKRGRRGRRVKGDEAIERAERHLHGEPAGSA